MSKIIQMKNKDNEKVYPNILIEKGDNYRVYADGYMEVWGTISINNIPAGTGKSSDKINYPYPFKNKDYNVQFSLRYGSAYWSNVAVTRQNSETSYLILYVWNNGGNEVEALEYYYKVSGYIR